MHLSIVIPTYNRKDDLVACINSLLRQDLDASRLEIIVVDNGPSTDGTDVFMKEMEALHSHIQYIQTTEKGCIVARNMGFARATGEILLTTDDDIELLHDDALTILLKTFTDTSIAMVGGLERRSAEPAPATPLSCSGTGIGQVTKWGTLTGGYESLDGCTNLVDVMQFRSCCMAIRKEVFQAIGGFQPIYDADGMGFRYETDLCMRAAVHGRIVINPQVRVWHKVAARSRGFDRGRGPRYLHLANRNHTYFMLTFFWKDRPWQWLLFDMFIGSYRTPGLFYLLRRGMVSPSLVRAVLSGKLAGYRMFRTH